MPLTMQFTLLGLARDFHPLDNAHAERTGKKATGCIQQLLSAARGFYLLNAKVQLYYNNVGKNWYTQTRFYRFVKAISA